MGQRLNSKLVKHPFIPTWATGFMKVFEMGIMKEKIPFCTHDLSKSGYRAIEDVALYPRLTLMRVQSNRRCRFVPTTYPNEGIEQ